MTTVSNEDLRRQLEELLAKHELTMDTFLQLGERRQLYEIDPDLDFAFLFVADVLGLRTAA